jgi:glycosyltransferase involved in cell wall biosynthesis
MFLNKLMRICYIANAESIHTQRWIQFFARKGHEIHLISPTPPIGDYPQNVSLHPIKVLQGIRGLNHVFTIVQIRRIMKRIHPDILHAHYVADYGFWAALSRVHPFVVTAWGSDVLVRPRESRFSKWMVKFVLRRADLITCDAEHLEHRMTELGAERERIKLIYFGVDTQKFSPGKGDLKFKEKLQLEPSSLTIISLRNLSPIYDVESILRAIPLVRDAIPDSKFIIAGDGEQRNYLETLAKSLEVSDSIRFVGRIPNDALPGYLASSNIYVSTALSDAGLAASTAEAMACELPVVITDFGNNRNWVKDGEGGFVIPTKSPAILANKIVYLLKDEDVRKRFGKINRRVIEERNNYEKEMRSMEETYFQLMNNKIKG